MCMRGVFNLIVWEVRNIGTERYRESRWERGRGLYIPFLVNCSQGCNQITFTSLGVCVSSVCQTACMHSLLARNGTVSPLRALSSHSLVYQIYSLPFISFTLILSLSFFPSARLSAQLISAPAPFFSRLFSRERVKKNGKMGSGESENDSE